MKNMEHYRNYIDLLIKKDLNTNPNFRIHRIKDCSEYALSDGKRLRPIIVLSICNCLNQLTGHRLSANGGALAVEFIHSASLIIDDMPMMDNDSMRRSKAAVHSYFGPTLAHLTAYNLIMVAFKHVFDNLKDLKKKAPFLAPKQFEDINNLVQDHFIHRLSLEGLCGGQYLDLHIAPEFTNLDRESKQRKIIQLIHLKTSSLFEIAFLLGWIFGGGIVDRAPELCSIAQSVGLLYQIVDDMEDRSQDKLKGNENNICYYFSAEELRDLFKEHLKNYREGLQELEIFTPALKELYNYLVSRFEVEFSSI